jgi:phage terminase large subunit
LTVWEGNCRQTLDGAIYANEIRQATAAEHIIRVPYDSAHPVHTFWDLGRADITAIWFAQTIGFEHRMIDYYWNTGHALDHYLKELQSRKYIYGTDWMPFDADSELLAAEKTIKQQAEAIGRSVQIVPDIGVANGINAARTLFGRCWFDERNCSDGLQALRHYQYKVDANTGHRSKDPLHNWASHGADAFRYFAVAITEPETKRLERRRRYPGSWMGA